MGRALGASGAAGAALLVSLLPAHAMVGGARGGGDVLLWARLATLVLSVLELGSLVVLRP